MSRLHVVQVSLDDTVFHEDTGSDTLKRQIEYFSILKGHSKNAMMSFVVLTNDKDVKYFNTGDLEFIPVYYKRSYSIFHSLYGTLNSINKRNPIHVVTSQTIHEDGWTSLVWAKLYRVPIVAQVHYNIFSSAAQKENFGKGLKGLVKKIISFSLIKKYAALRVVGERIKTDIIRKNLAQNIEVIPVPVTLTGGPNKSSNDERDTPTVLFVGRLIKAKRVDILLKVAAEVLRQNEMVQFVIVGDGPLRNKLESYARDLKIENKVQFKGQISHRYLSNIYSSSDVLLLTSSYEGFGRVIVEAYIHKLPVIATNTSGIEDIVVDKKTGFLHGFNDVKRISESVLRLLSDNELRKKMGEAGNRHVRKIFDPRQLAEKWIKLLVDTSQYKTYECFQSPEALTYGRCKYISKSNYSLLRTLEYEAINGLTLNGRTLDVGGGAINSYYDLIDNKGKIESINIDPDIKPTIVADINNIFPFESDTYDNAICFNTLEHIYNDTSAIKEILRILKPSGTFYLIVPFMYRSHASPSDYHRHSMFWWRDFLLSCGVQEDNLRIEPLVLDQQTSAFSLKEFRRFRGVRKKMSLTRAFLSYKIRGSKIPYEFYDYALGYYITGRK